MKRIKTNNLTEFRKAFNIFILLGGYEIDCAKSIDDYITKFIYYENFPYYVGLSHNNKVTCWSASDNFVHFDDTENLTSFIAEIVSESPTTIKEVGDFDAVITSKNIKVGCQIISFEKFDEIAEAVKKHRK